MKDTGIPKSRKKDKRLSLGLFIKTSYLGPVWFPSVPGFVPISGATWAGWCVQTEKGQGFPLKILQKCPLQL